MEIASLPTKRKYRRRTKLISDAIKKAAAKMAIRSKSTAPTVDEAASEDSDYKKSRQKPANENAWYCLATLYGEHTDRIDEKLATNNRDAWHKWLYGRMPENELRNLFFDRTKKTVLPPQPTDKIDFTYTLFDRPVCFRGFEFQPSADFSSSRFFSDINFSGAVFSGNVDFQSVKFLQDANFDGSQFNGRTTDLGYLEFIGKASFRSARLANCSFNATKFRDSAYFEHASFHNKASFVRAFFRQYAIFDEAEFNGNVDFAGTTLTWTSFRSTKFASNVSFRDTKFTEHIDFINAKFGGQANFVRARFESGVPDFRGATMHEATEWHDVVWPKPPSGRMWFGRFRQEERNHAYVQVYAYERLKQEMERLKKHEDEQDFFRRELRARRPVSRALSVPWVLNLAYQALSNYGISVVRPVLWLIGVFITGAAIFARAPIHCGAAMPVRLALKLAIIRDLTY
jgi:uncharacterized protein YjbI with pentapeptide repeats